MNGGTPLHKTGLLDPGASRQPAAHRVSVSIPAPSFPGVRMTTPVRNREHGHERFACEERSLRKIAYQGAPDVLLDDRGLKWIPARRRLEDLELGFGRDVRHHI